MTPSTLFIPEEKVSPEVIAGGLFTILPSFHPLRPITKTRLKFLMHFKSSEEQLFQMMKNRRNICPSQCSENDLGFSFFHLSEHCFGF